MLPSSTHTHISAGRWRCTKREKWDQRRWSPYDFSYINSRHSANLTDVYPISVIVTAKKDVRKSVCVDRAQPQYGGNTAKKKAPGAHRSVSTIVLRAVHQKAAAGPHAKAVWRRVISSCPSNFSTVDARRLRMCVPLRGLAASRSSSLRMRSRRKVPSSSQTAFIPR